MVGVTKSNLLGLLLLGAAVAAVAVSARSQSPASSSKADDDAYTPLRLYDGAWDLEMKGGKEVHTTHIANHCEKTGMFFVCEQVIDGKSEDLVVFLPTGVSGRTYNYKTQGLSVTAEKPRDWGKLEIQGERWVYSSEATENGVKTFWRTLNIFSGTDKIHFEIQSSSDGVSWETKRTGEERRAAR